MSQVGKLLKENIYFLIRFLISFYIFSVHHHVNFIVRIFEIILIMFLLAYTDLNMLNNFLYPFLLPWQLVKFSFQLVLFNRYYITPTLLFILFTRFKSVQNKGFSFVECWEIRSILACF